MPITFGRRYTFGFENVTVSTAQDLLLLPGPAAGKVIVIERLWVKNVDTTLVAGQDLRLRCQYLPATVTLGSGGTGSITPSKIDQADAACSVTTARINDTTPATTSGTAVTLLAEGCHLYQGYYSPELDFIVNPSTALSFGLLSTVSSAIKLSGGCLFREIG